MEGTRGNKQVPFEKGVKTMNEMLMQLNLTKRPLPGSHLGDPEHLVLRAPKIHVMGKSRDSRALKRRLADFQKTKMLDLGSRKKARGERQWRDKENQTNYRPDR